MLSEIREYRTTNIGWWWTRTSGVKNISKSCINGPKVTTILDSQLVGLHLSIGCSCTLRMRRASIPSEIVEDVSSNTFRITKDLSISVRSV